MTEMKLLRTLRDIGSASALTAAFLFGIIGELPARAFIHPGGLLTTAGLSTVV